MQNAKNTILSDTTKTAALMFMNRLLLFVCLLLLIVAEILRVYLVMPYPGSQVKDTIVIAYWLSTNIFWIRIFAAVIILASIISFFPNGKVWEKSVLAAALLSFGMVYYFFNYKLEADKIFYQPATNNNITAGDTVDKSKLVIGIVVNNIPKAYPIQLIGYHHQVRDTLNDEQVMVTYCTVCRTGRVFSPIVNGKPETFRLVGMDHFNAMFEDSTTKSWWQQATGIAVAGPLTGYVLKEFPSSQVTLDAWLRKYPASLIMKPDTTFMDNYFRLEDYDRGAMRSDLVRRDIISWSPKSWIVGVQHRGVAKAYDWNELVAKRIIHDTIAKLPLLITMEKDTTSFHVYDRRVKGVVLNFLLDKNIDLLTDTNTSSVWNIDGVCIEGELKNEKLKPIQGYNEFWHSWLTFHPRTLRYNAR